jgi:hypothetical protein
MRVLAFLFVGLVASVSFLAHYPELRLALTGGDALGFVFAMANALAAPAITAFIFLPSASAWNFSVVGVLWMHGVDLIVSKTGLGYWEHIPGQGTTQGGLLLLIAIAILVTTLLARRKNRLRP